MEVYSRNAEEHYVISSDVSLSTQNQSEVNNIDWLIDLNGMLTCLG